MDIELHFVDTVTNEEIYLPSPEFAAEQAEITVDDKILTELETLNQQVSDLSLMVVILIAVVLAHGFADKLLGWCYG